MKKFMVVFAVLLLTSCVTLGAWAQEESQLQKRFEETLMQCRALGAEAAYVLDHEGALWVWPYDESQPKQIGALPRLPEALYETVPSYGKLSQADRAQADETVQLLIPWEGTLYGLNQLAGRLAIVDGEGAHWQASFDPALLLDARGNQRMIMGMAVKEGVAYLLVDNMQDGSANQMYNGSIVSIDLASGQIARVGGAPDAHSLCAYPGGLYLLCQDAQGKHWLAAFDPATGTSRILPTQLPEGAMGGLSYDAAGDTLCLTAMKGIFQAVGEGDFCLAVENPAAYVSDLTLGQCLPGERYAFTGDGIQVVAVPGGNG